MSLIPKASGLLERVGLKKGRSPLSREQALEARPVRNPRLKWRVNDSGCVEVIIVRRQDAFGRIMAFVFAVPQTRPVVLDEVGSRVWQLCDGERTVNEVARTLANEYKLGRREVEMSLTEYLRTLGKRGMIGFLVPEEFLEEAGGELVGLGDVGTTRAELDAARREAEPSEEAGPDMDETPAEDDSDSELAASPGGD